MSRGKTQNRTSRKDLVSQRDSYKAVAEAELAINEYLRGDIYKLKSDMATLEQEQRQSQQALAVISAFSRIDTISHLIWDNFRFAGAVAKQSHNSLEIKIARFGAIPPEFASGWKGGQVGPPEKVTLAICPRCNYVDETREPILPAQPENPRCWTVDATDFKSGGKSFFADLSLPETGQFDTLTNNATSRRDKESSCPTGKKQHDSRVAADGFLSLLTMKNGPQSEPLTSYDCNLCGKAHLGRSHDHKKGKLT
jgi:hypothetical protein